MLAPARHPGAPAGAIRVLRVIARMNIGGPAHHVSMLSGRLDRARFETLLAYGSLGPGEGSFESLARKEGCVVTTIPGLSPRMRPHADMRALIGLIRLIRAYRPRSSTRTRRRPASSDGSRRRSLRSRDR